MNARIESEGQPGAAEHRPSFAEEIGGQAGRPFDVTLAKLMRDVYDYDRNGAQEGVDGWKPLSTDELRGHGIDPTLLKNESSGFLAAVYGDGQGRYVLAYSGTDEGKDWLTNFGQGLGFETSQYNQAMALAKQTKVAFGQDMVITGHSLGGGLAAAAAMVTDTPAVTFNAAGIHDRTLERIGLDAAAVKHEANGGLIRRYAVQHEILTGLQEHAPLLRHAMPDAVGHKIELADPEPLTFWQGLNPVKSVRHSVEMHYIDAVIRAQETLYGPGAEPRVGLMSEDGHPAHPLFRQTMSQLSVARHPGAPSTPEQDERLAGALALEARRGGLDRVDRVVFSDDGRRAFVVQGEQSESQKRAFVDVAAARELPLARASQDAAALGGPAPQSTTRQAEQHMSVEPAVRVR